MLDVKKFNVVSLSLLSKCCDQLQMNFTELNLIRFKIHDNFINPREKSNFPLGFSFLHRYSSKQKPTPKSGDLFRKLTFFKVKLFKVRGIKPQGVVTSLTICKNKMCWFHSISEQISNDWVHWAAENFRVSDRIPVWRR